MAMPVKGKKTGGARKPSGRVTPSKKTVSKVKALPKRKPASKAKPVAKAAKKLKMTVKRAAAAVRKSVVKKPVRPSKPSRKAVAKKVVPKKPAARKPAAAVRKPKLKLVPSKSAAKLKPVAKPKPVAKAKPAIGKAAAARPAPAKPATAKAAPAGGKVVPIRPAAAPKPKGRRSRLRIPTDSVPTAAWFPSPESRPRPSSFIPAPPRAESAFTTAAPPASSDRLVRDEDLAGLQTAIRTYPVRVDIEMVAGRTSIYVLPDNLTVRPGEGIEWDFRYLGGTDALAEEIIIEFNKPSPFPKSVFKSKNPGTARPHRQISGPATNSAVGHEFSYTIRCISLVKAEMAMARPSVQVAAAPPRTTSS